MEASIFTRSGKVWTRFKILNKELKIYIPLIEKYVDITKPSKQSSRYTYFEVVGDLLNSKTQIYGGTE